jgi:hypothetical protein
MSTTIYEQRVSERRPFLTGEDEPEEEKSVGPKEVEEGLEGWDHGDGAQKTGPSPQNVAGHSWSIETCKWSNSVMIKVA